MFASSLLIISEILVSVLTGAKRVVSSANRIKSKKFVELCISLMYMMKSKGPKIEPCGTPVVIGRNSEDVPQ
jgi:hypothetical protein